MLKQITEGEAIQYIKCEDDFAEREAVYYTLTPNLKPGWEGWENVTYYTAKKKTEYLDREGDGNSWVYIMSNPSIPDLYKIGYTNKDLEVRVKEVSRGTGVAMSFEVIWAFKCFDGEMLEYEVHKCLDKYRENSRREFFRVSLEEAKSTIRTLGMRYSK
jgi:hypothetical protein